MSKSSSISSLDAIAGRNCAALLYNEIAMMKLETTQTLPLTLTEDGTIRITGSRVSLDSIVHHFQIGATAEQIAQKFPSLQLVDIYGAITYYLSHRDTVEEYLRARACTADEIRRLIEASQDTAGIRERLLARSSQQQG